MAKSEMIIDLDKVNQISDKHDEAKQIKIRYINSLVEQAQSNRANDTAMLKLLELFNPYILLIAKKYYENNKRIVSWDDVHSFVKSCFVELTLKDYTIGGRAHYNVFIRRMLNLRTLYFIEQRIKDQKRHEVLDEETIDPKYIISYDMADDIIHRMHVGVMVSGIICLVDQHFCERDSQMFKDYYFQEGMSYQILAKRYYLSTPRVSSIITSMKNKLRELLPDEFDPDI